MIGFRTLYSDMYKCLTCHGMVVHSQQVEWITDAKLGVFSDISQPATVEALERSMQATGSGVDLFAQQPRMAALAADTAELTYGAAMLCADPGKLYHADITLCCMCQYVADRVLMLDGACVADAVKIYHVNAEGENRRHMRSDLLDNLQHGWLVYDLHAGDLGGAEKRRRTPDVRRPTQPQPLSGRL